MTLIAVAVAGGCNAPSPSPLVPLRDDALKRPPTVLAAEAAKATYPADAPVEPATLARAQVGYALDVVEVANLSGEAWGEFSVWVNKEYTITLPGLAAGGLRRILQPRRPHLSDQQPHHPGQQRPDLSQRHFV